MPKRKRNSGNEHGAFVAQVIGQTGLSNAEIRRKVTSHIAALADPGGKHEFLLELAKSLRRQKGDSHGPLVQAVYDLGNDPVKEMLKARNTRTKRLLDGSAPHRLSGNVLIISDDEDSGLIVDPVVSHSSDSSAAANADGASVNGEARSTLTDDGARGHGSGPTMSLCPQVTRSAAPPSRSPKVTGNLLAPSSREPWTPVTDSPLMRNGPRQNSPAHFRDKPPSASRPSCKRLKVIDIPDDTCLEEDARLQKAIDRLIGNRWLNDDAIRGVLSLLEHERIWIHEAHQTKLGEGTRIQSPGPNIRQIIFAHEHSKHWTCIIVDRKQQNVTQYDSLQNRQIDVGKALVMTMVGSWLSLPETLMYNWKSLFTQSGGNDCGVFTCLHPMYVCLQLPPPQTCPDARLWRLLFAALLRRRLRNRATAEHPPLASLPSRDIREARRLLSQLEEAQKVLDALHARLSAIVSDIELQRKEWTEESRSVACANLSDEESCSLSLSRRERRNRELKILLAGRGDLSAHQGRCGDVHAVQLMVQEETERVRQRVRIMSGEPLLKPFEEIQRVMAIIRSGQPFLPSDLATVDATLPDLLQQWQIFKGWTDHRGDNDETV